MRIVRFVAALMLIVAALLFGIQCANFPFQLSKQVQDNWDYLRQFEATAKHIENTGNLHETEPERWRQSSNWTADITTSQSVPRSCASTFRKAKSDRYILSFWRGEWSECYAYPSGRTTLALSVNEYWSSLWTVWVLLVFLTVAVAMGAYQVMPKIRDHDASPH